MRVRYLKDTDTEYGPKKAGDELEHPAAFYLCQLGIAEPVDEPAKAKHAEWLEASSRRKKAAAKRRDEIYAAKIAERAENKKVRQKKFAKKIAI